MTLKAYIQMGVILGTVAVSGLCGGLVGYEIRDRQATERGQNCAAGILAGDYSPCRVEVREALGQVTLGSKEIEIEYRDRTIPVFVEGQQRNAENERQYQELIAALSNVDKTNACAASPAFSLRRQQLLDREGPSVPAEPQADPNPG